MYSVTFHCSLVLLFTGDCLSVCWIYSCDASWTSTSQSHHEWRLNVPSRPCYCIYKRLWASDLKGQFTQKHSWISINTLSVIFCGASFHSCGDNLFKVSKTWSTTSLHDKKNMSPLISFNDSLRLRLFFKASFRQWLLPDTLMLENFSYTITTRNGEVS